MKAAAAEIYRRPFSGAVSDCTVQDYSPLRGRTILVTGGTGLAGSVPADMLCLPGDEFGHGLRLVLISRDRRKSKDNWIK